MGDNECTLRSQDYPYHLRKHPNDTSWTGTCTWWEDGVRLVYFLLILSSVLMWSIFWKLILSSVLYYVLMWSCTLLMALMLCTLEVSLSWLSEQFSYMQIGVITSSALCLVWFLVSTTWWQKLFIAGEISKATIYCNAQVFHENSNKHNIASVLIKLSCSWQQKKHAKSSDCCGRVFHITWWLDSHVISRVESTWF